jgi:hypothetical protein
MGNKMPNLISSKYRTESRSSEATLPVPRIRHWMVGVAVSVGAIAAGAVVAHAEGDIPGTGIAVPDTSAEFESVGQTLLTQLHTDIADAANTGYTNYLQDAAMTAGSITWLDAEITKLAINNDTATDPAGYLYAGETKPIIHDEKGFLTQIVNFFQGLKLPEEYANSTLASAFNQDVVYEIDINNALIGNPVLKTGGDISVGVAGNVQNGDLFALTTDTWSMLGFDSDLYHEALWTVDVAALAGLF